MKLKKRRRDLNFLPRRSVHADRARDRWEFDRIESSRDHTYIALGLARHGFRTSDSGRSRGGIPVRMSKRITRGSAAATTRRSRRRSCGFFLSARIGATIRDARRNLSRHRAAIHETLGGSGFRESEQRSAHCCQLRRSCLYSRRPLFAGHERRVENMKFKPLQ